MMIGPYEGPPPLIVGNHRHSPAPGRLQMAATPSPSFQRFFGFCHR